MSVAVTLYIASAVPFGIIVCCGLFGCLKCLLHCEMCSERHSCSLHCDQDLSNMAEHNEGTSVDIPLRYDR